MELVLYHVSAALMRDLADQIAEYHVRELYKAKMIDTAQDGMDMSEKVVEMMEAYWLRKRFPFIGETI